MNKFVLSGIMSLCTSQLVQANTSNGDITLVRVHQHNLAVVKTTNYEPESCSSSTSEWAFKIDNDEGKAMFSLVLTAAASSKQITIVGTGECTDWPDREKPRYIDIRY